MISRRGGIGAFCVTTIAAVFLIGAAPMWLLGPDSQRDRLWGPQAIPALKAFLGRRALQPAGYIIPEEPLWVNISGGMTGPPGDMLLLQDGTRIVHGCRFHSCVEKSAIVVSPDDRILAAGLVNFHCRFTNMPAQRRLPPRRRASTCDDGETLTMFLRPSDAYREPLEAWAAQEVGHALPSEIVHVP